MTIIININSDVMVRNRTKFAGAVTKGLTAFNYLWFNSGMLKENSAKKEQGEWKKQISTLSPLKDESKVVLGLSFCRFPIRRSIFAHL